MAGGDQVKVEVKEEELGEMETEEILPPISFNILATIRVAQAQHGLRHGDYSRYREYCQRRLRRLYVKLKFLHGRMHRFQQKILEPSTVKEVRHLQIPLTCAERAWAMAMEKKKALEEAGGGNHKRKSYIVRRLAKACKYGEELSRLCGQRGDARTGLEAEGYSSMLAGHHQMEKSKWDQALVKFTRAKKIFEELSKVGEFEQQALFTQMLEELEPSMRFCKYQLEKDGSVIEKVDSGVLANLQSQLAELAVEAQSRSKAPSSVNIEWCGVQYPVRNERLQSAVVAAQQFEQELTSEADPELQLYDKVVTAYSDLKTLVKQAINAGGGANALGVASDLEGLQTAVLGTYLQYSIRRTLIQIKQQSSGFDEGLLKSLASKKPKGLKVRPDDLVKLHDSLIGLVGELSELGMKIGGAQGEVLMEGCSAQVGHYQAVRCYYVAHSLLMRGKFPEAYALFQRCTERAQDAIGRYEELPDVDMEAIEKLENVSQKASAFRCVARAQCSAEVLQQERTVQSGMDNLQLTQNSSKKKPTGQPTKYLADNLDNWEPFISLGGKGVRIFRIPPPLYSMPTRAIVFDSALNHIDKPDISHRLPKKTEESTFSKLLGFAGWRRN